jgi:hypothetical protein
MKIEITIYHSNDYDDFFFNKNFLFISLARNTIHFRRNYNNIMNEQRFTKALK